MQGEVIRFDQAKGYGFISPAGAGEDVFLHVNDLLDDKHLVRPGVAVEFVVENGERGLKASSVRVISPVPGSTSGGLSAGSVSVLREPSAGDVARRPSSSGVDEDLVDVLSEMDFSREVTEVLLRVEPGLTGAQVLAVRRALAELGGKYGWIGS